MSYKEKLEQCKDAYSVKSMELISQYRDGYIGKDVYRVELNNGLTKKMDRITKAGGNGDAVIIIPVTEDDRYVMIIESRPNIKNGVAIEFPAGMVDPGEEPIDAAKRELLEETGYSCENIIEIENHFQDQGCSNAIIRIYLATGCKKIKEQRLDDTESISFVEMTYDEIYDLIMNADTEKIGINDSGSKVAFLTYTMKYKQK
jgi:ADP-ribose pyrophosphatase